MPLSPQRTRVLVPSALAAVLVVMVVWLLMIAGGERSTEVTPAQGGLVTDFVIDGPGVGDHPRFGAPMGVAVSDDGSRIVVVDATYDRVCVFDAEGEFVREFGGRGIAKPAAGFAPSWREGRLNYPVDVAMDEQDNVYIADLYNDSVSVFSLEGTFLRRFPDPNEVVGRGASGRGGTGIAVTAIDVSDGLVAMTDRYQIVITDTQGGLVNQFGRPGRGEGTLDHPGGIAIAPDGTLVVSDSNNSRVAGFSVTGELLWMTDESSFASQSTGFAVPRGIAGDGDDGFIVADPMAQRLIRVTADGQPAAEYGVYGSEVGQIGFVNDVAVSDARLVVADRANRRVQVMRFEEN